MKQSIIAASLTALLFANTAFANTMQSLNQDQVNDLLKDKSIKTIPLVTMNGSLTSNTFTGYFESNDKIAGKMTKKPGNGPINDTGAWTVKSDGTLCVTWQHWNSSKPICVAIYKLQNSVLFVNVETEKLETLVLNDNITKAKP